MVQMPRRSVTRFFIPLIDVLTLLFCVFLVMPLAKSAGEDPSQSTAEELKKVQAQLDRLRGMGADEPERVRKELEELRQAKVEAIKERFMPLVLEIDGTNGKLYSQRAGRRLEIDERAARDLMEQDRRQYDGKREIMYVILYPRLPNTGFPRFGDREAIARWFQGAAVSFNDPHNPPEKGQ
jgi:hypothetical protein